MRWTLVSMAVLVAAMIGLALWRGDGALSAGFRQSGVQLIRFLPLLVVAFLVMGFAEALMPREVVEGWLSDAAGWRGLGVAWLAGALTPGGGIVGMPLAAGLLGAGASPAVLVTYLTSLATLSLMRLPVEVGFLGIRLTALRVAACLALPILAGLIARAMVALAPAQGGS